MMRKLGVVCVLASAMLLIGVPASWAATIVNQFAVLTDGPPLYFVEGVTYGNGSVWYSNSDTLFQLDPLTGTIIKQQDVSGYINDLDWVNGNLVGARVTPPSIVVFDPDDFSEVLSYDTSAVGEPEGVAFDGEVILFSTDGPPAMVYELDPATGGISEGRPSVATDPEALAYGNGVLWEAGKLEGAIHKVKRATGQLITSFVVPSADIHGMGWDGQYLWASSQQNACVYQFDVTDVNVAPTLSWAGPPGYTSDGVDPDSGNSLTMFDFRVKFTDADDEAPGHVLLYISRDGLWMSGTPWMMQSTGDISYDDGAVFSYQTRLPAGSTYQYLFYAANDSGEATGAPTVLRSGPVVSDAPPTLAWTGQPGYTADGVEPGSGQANSTPFEFRVLYQGVASAQYVRVHILRNGDPIPSSPQEMQTTDTDPLDGAIYTLQRKLPRSRDYSYYFEASDGNSEASGPPTSETPGPIVGNRAPVLDWTGAPGFEEDGINPDVTSDMVAVNVRVLYTDADNDLPTGVSLRVARAGTEVAQSPIALSRVGGTKPRDGVVYRGTLSLSRGKTYTYWFEANDGYTAAVGPATVPQDGPIVNSPPYLEWVSAGQWMTDGVRPNKAVGRTGCEFRVVYRDLDGDKPEEVQVEVRRYQNPLNSSPFAMHKIRGASPVSGLTYARTIWLNPGKYWYRFVAGDGYSEARGVPTQWKAGPVIKQAAAAQITSVAAVPAGVGVQLSFSLSTAATVQAEVLNVAGRPVRALAPKDCEAGGNTLLWDGMSATGLPAPAGLYLISIAARDEEGGESRALGRVYLNR